MDLGIIAALVMWGIVALFSIVHLAKGFGRGAKKSLYFSLTNVFAMFIALLIFSFISISWFLTPEGLISMLQSFDVNTQQFEPLLEDQAIVSLVFSLIDVSLKLVLFFILYPLLRWLISLIIFKPMWRIVKVIGKKNKLYYDYETGEYVEEVKSITLTSRFFGGFFGFARGFVAGLLIIMPLVIIIGMTEPLINAITNFDDNNNGSNTSTLSSASLASDSIDDMIDEFMPYFEYVSTLNKVGPYSVLSNIKMGDKTFGDSMFDLAFKIEIEVDDVKVRVSLTDEFSGIFDIAGELYNGGYLNSEFDFESISEDDLPLIEKAFSYLGDSTLFTNLIPVGTNLFINNFSEDLININFTNRPYSMQAINEFMKIDWSGESGEFMKLYNVIEEALTFGSVGEWLELINDEKYYELTPNQAKHLGQILRNIGNLDILTLANVAIDYATSLDEVNSMFTYVDEADRESYLQNKLSFILEDTKYFSKGHFEVIANVVELLFANPNIDLKDLITNVSDPNYLLSPIHVDYLANIIGEVANLELLLDAIPLGVDFALYEALKLDIDNPEVIVIDGVLQDFKWDDEINNITDLYRSVAQLGIQGFFGDNPNMPLLVDELVKNHIIAIKNITNQVLTSEGMEGILQVALPSLVSLYYNPTDEMGEEIKTFLLDELLVTDDKGVVEFKAAQEVANILTILDGLYQTTDYTYIDDLVTRLSGGANISYSEIVNILVGLDSFSRNSASNLTYEQFILAINNLQILDYSNDFILTLVGDMLDDQVYISEDNTKDFIIKNELVKVIDLLKAYGGYHQNAVGNFNDVSLSAFVNNELKAYVNDLPLLAKTNVAFYLDKLITENTEFVVPIYSSYESDEWLEEVDTLLLSVFDIHDGVFISGINNDLVLNFNFINNIADDYMQLPLEVVTKFGNVSIARNTFSRIANSKILSVNIKDYVNSLSIDEVDIVWPESLNNGDLIDGEELAVLISDTLSFVSDYNRRSLGLETIEDVLNVNVDNLNGSLLINAYYGVNYNIFNKFANNKVLNEVFVNILDSSKLHNTLYKTLNTALPFTVEDGIFEDLTLVGKEFHDLLKLFYLLRLPSYIVNTPQDQIVDAMLVYMTDHISKDDLTEILEYPVIHQILTRTLNHSEVRSYVLNTGNDLLANSLPSQFSNLSLDLESYYQSIIDFEKQYLYGNESLSLFDVSKITELLDVYQLLDISSTSDLTNLNFRVIDQFINNQQLNVVTKSELVRTLIGTVLTDQGLFDFLTEYGNDLLNTYNLNYVIADDQLKVGRPILVEENGRLMLEQEVLISSLEILAAIEIQDIISKPINGYEIITKLNDVAFPLTGDGRTRLDVLYDNIFVNEALTFIVENEDLAQSISNTVNNQLENILPRINSNLVLNNPLTVDDVLITSEMVGKENFVTLINTVKQLDEQTINSITSINTLSGIYQALKLNEDSAILIEFLQVPLFKTMIGRVFDHGLYSDLASQISNIYLNQFNLDVELSSDVFHINYNDKDELIVDLVELFVSAYATGYEIGKPVGLHLIKELETQTITYNGLAEFRIDRLFASNLIINYLDQILRHDDVLEGIAKVSTDQLNSITNQLGLNLNYTFTKDLFEVPAIALKDGIINPEEYKVVIRSFNDLDINSMSELSNFTNVDYIYDKLVNTNAVETLFESSWLHIGLSRVTKDSNLHNRLANLIENQASSRFGIDVDIDGRVFDFTDPKYQIYATTGSRAGNIDVSVIKQLLEVATRNNWAKDFSSNLNDITRMLLKEGTDGRVHIDVISENKVVTAIYDRLLNPNHNEYNLSDLYTELINNIANRINLSQLVIADSSFLFDYDVSMLNNDNVLDSSDIAKIVRGLSILDLTNPTNIKVNTIANSINNDVNNNGIDDFEELMDANLINHLLTTALREERLYEQATTIIGNTLGGNINIPVSVVKFPEELIINNRVSITELKKLVFAVALIEQNSSEFANLAPEVLLKLVDQNIENGVDDLDRVLESDYLLFVIGNVINHDGLNRLANRVINRLLDTNDTDILVTAPSYLLSNNPGIENGRIRREELRNIIVSMKLMFGDESIDTNSVNLSLVLDLIGRDDNSNGIDDFDEVNQGYIHYILATALTNESVVNLIAQGLEVDINDVIFSNVMYDENGNMSKAEVKQLMLGLEVLGISDFQDLESGMNPNMLNELDDSQIDVLIASSYLYRVIDLTIKGQVNLPNAAFNDSGDYIGYVGKDEINKLIEAIEIIGGDLNIDINNVTVLDLNNLIALESNIIDYFITKEIDERYPNLSSLAYRDLEKTIYTTLELSHLTYTLETLIGVDGYITELDSLNIDTLTDNDLDEIIKLESIIVTRIISTEITTNIITNTPDDSFIDPITRLDLKQSELENLVSAVTILGGNISNLNTLDENDITATRLDALIELKSPLINVQMSDTIKDLIDVSEDALDLDGVILESEMRGLASAIALLGGNVAGIKDLDANEVYGETLKDLLDIKSIIVDHQISGVIVEVLGDDIPDEAYSLDNEELIANEEMYKLANSLTALGVSAGEISNINTNALSSLTLSEIHGYESVIIDRQISNSINETLVDLPIPVDAKDSEGHIKRSEVGKLIESIDIVGKPIDQVKELDANSLEKDKLDQLHDLNSLIIDRIMSNSIKEGLDNDVADGALDSEGHIMRAEIGKLIATIEILGGTGGTINTIIDIDANTLGEEELEELLDLDSFIIDELISDSIKSSITIDVYSDSLDANGNILKAEMYHIVSALGHLGGTVANITGLDANDLSTDKLNNLHGLESTIIDRLISNSLRDVLDYDIYSPTLDAKGYIDRDEVGKLIQAIDYTGAEDFTTINSLSASTVTPAVLANLVGLESVIIDRQLSKTIDAAFTAPSYVKDVDGFITRDELQKLSTILTALNLSSLDEINNLDSDTINSTSMDIMISSGSGIAHHTMSNAIIDAELNTVDSLIVGGPMNGEVKVSELQGITYVISLLPAGSTVNNLKNLDGAALIDFFSDLTEPQINQIFGNTEQTIMYYRVSTALKVIDAQIFPLSNYDDEDFVDNNRTNHLTRDAVIETLIN